jgi:hypothetical protein
MGTAQLAKQHGNKLGPTGKTPGMTFGFRLFNHLLELQTRKKLEYLTENAAKSIHG